MSISYADARVGRDTSANALISQNFCVLIFACYGRRCFHQCGLHSSVVRDKSGQRTSEVYIFEPAALTARLLGLHLCCMLYASMN